MQVHVAFFLFVAVCFLIAFMVIPFTYYLDRIDHKRFLRHYEDFRRLDNKLDKEFEDKDEPKQ